MAGALGFALAGPRSYGGVLVEDAVMGERRYGGSGRRRYSRARSGSTGAPTCV